MIDTDVTQQPPAWTKPDGHVHTSGTAMAAYLMELAAAVAKLGEIPKTSISVSFQVGQFGAGNRERCAAVDAIAGALGMQARFGECADWWDYSTSNWSHQSARVNVFTSAVTAEEYEQARRDAGCRGCDAAAMVKGTSPCEGEPDSVRVVVDDAGTEIAGCPVHAGLLAASLTTDSDVADPVDAGGAFTEAELTPLDLPIAEEEQLVTAMQTVGQRLVVSDTVMTSGLTGHWAYRDTFNHDWWWVTWLPYAQFCDRNQVITAMTIAMHVTPIRSAGDTLDELHPVWPLIVTWAAELGLSAAEAVRLAGAELPAAAADAYVTPTGQVQDMTTGRWSYAREGFTQARERQLQELCAHADGDEASAHWMEPGEQGRDLHEPARAGGKR